MTKSEANRENSLTGPLNNVVIGFMVSFHQTCLIFQFYVIILKIKMIISAKQMVYGVRRTVYGVRCTIVSMKSWVQGPRFKNSFRISISRK